MWESIKELIGSSAPILGSLLGGPVGGSVGALIAQALGVSEDPKEIEEAIKNDPNALLKLKELELSKYIADLKAENDKQLLQLEDKKLYFNDTNNARDLQKSALSQEDTFSKRFTYYLATFWSIVGASYIFLITFIEIPLANQRFADTEVGFLLGTVVAAVIQYFFGSSKGSNDKGHQIDALLEQIKENKPK
jgi:hypothetical protein